VQKLPVNDRESPVRAVPAGGNLRPADNPATIAILPTLPCCG